MSRKIIYPTDEKRAHKRQYARQRRAELERAGICYICGKEPATPGFKTCAKCRERNNAYTQQRITAGICSCGKTIEDRKTKCPDCLKRLSESKKEKVRIAKSLGLCINCAKNEAVPGLSMCVECIIHKSEYRQSRGPQVISEKRKEAHRRYNRERNERLKQAGICICCGQKPISRASNSLCIDCDTRKKINGKKLREKTKIQKQPKADELFFKRRDA